VTKRKIYSTRGEAKAEIFDFIEMFYTQIKRHIHTGGVSSAKYQEAYFWNQPVSSESREVQSLELRT
jgi:putative transposase